MTASERIRQAREARCEQCGEPQNPVARMLGPVCGRCCRANHKAVANNSQHSVKVRP